MTVIILAVLAFAAGAAICWLAIERRRYRRLLDRTLTASARLAATIEAQRETISSHEGTISCQGQTIGLQSLMLKVVRKDLEEARRALIVQIGRQEGIDFADLLNS
jgi:hypothetical protein